MSALEPRKDPRMDLRLRPGSQAFSFGSLVRLVRRSKALEVCVPRPNPECRETRR